MARGMIGHPACTLNHSALVGNSQSSVSSRLANASYLSSVIPGMCFNRNERAHGAAFRLPGSNEKRRPKGERFLCFSGSNNPEFAATLFTKGTSMRYLERPKSRHNYLPHKGFG